MTEKELIHCAESVREWLAALVPSSLDAIDAELNSLTLAREAAVAHLDFEEASSLRSEWLRLGVHRGQAVREWKLAFPVEEAVANLQVLLEAVDLLRAMVADLREESSAYQRGVEDGIERGGSLKLLEFAKELGELVEATRPVRGQDRVRP